jgi:sulfate adenylyltransferase
MAEKIFRTLDPKHPGVATFTGLGRLAISGPIEVLNFSYFQQDFPDTFRTAVEIRNEIAERGWQTPWWRSRPAIRCIAHTKSCARWRSEAVNADGMLIHMLLGKLKAGDIPAYVRDAAIRKMVELYFPAEHRDDHGLRFRHALCRSARGGSARRVPAELRAARIFIVGRDHAGVGSYYGAFDAQTIFDEEVPAGALTIQIFRADHTAYSKKLHRVVMMRDAPDHTPEDFVQPSGTKVREMLAAGQDLPIEFARPEIAKILMGYYQSEARK